MSMDPAASAAEDSDQEDMPSMLSVLRARYTSAGVADAKAKAGPSRPGQQASKDLSTRPKPKPKAGVKPKAADEGGPVRVSGANRKRKAAVEADLLDAASEAAEGEMASGDIEVIEGFRAKFNALRSITPPEDDGNFKDYMADHLTKVQNLASEIRAKKKSVGRRRGKAEDPMIEALVSVEEAIRDMALLNKRTSSIIQNPQPKPDL